MTRDGLLWVLAMLSEEEDQLMRLVDEMENEQPSFESLVSRLAKDEV